MIFLTSLERVVSLLTPLPRGVEWVDGGGPSTVGPFAARTSSLPPTGSLGRETPMLVNALGRTQLANTHHIYPFTGRSSM